MLEHIYQLGLDHFNNDELKAAEFTVGFCKEAGLSSLLSEVALGARRGVQSVANVAGGGKPPLPLPRVAAEALMKGLGTGAAAAGAGLAIHGIASTIGALSRSNLEEKFKEALKKAISGSPTLQNADPVRLNEYAKTVFKFAPHVSGDPNLLANVLTYAVTGESMDVTIIRTLSDLEAKYQENRKNSLFTPKVYT